jgi:hypothetical protein
MDTKELWVSYNPTKGFVIVHGDEVTEPLCDDDALAALMALGVSKDDALSGLISAEEFPEPSGFQFA